MYSKLNEASAKLPGARALIQGCREHKKRRVSEALPKRLRASVRTTLPAEVVSEIV